MVDKKSKIIIVNTPPWGILMPPLGIAYLSSYLKSQGIVPDVYDLNLELYLQADEKQKEFWRLDTINRFLPVDIAHNIFNNFKDRLEELAEELSSYEIIAFSVNNFISTTLAGLLGTCIKKRFSQNKIVLGGPGCFYSWDRQTVAKDSVDFFVLGEGELAFHQLIKAIEENRYPTSIPGVFCSQKRGEGSYIPLEPVKNLDAIPFPTFSEFDLKKYNHGSEYKPLPMLTSRGCINSCSYCIDCQMCNFYRIRSPKHIISEINHHVENYGITHLEFNDLLCNGNLYRLDKLCDRLVESDFGLTWSSYAAIRKNMGFSLLEKMRKTGCSSLCYGMESGSDFVLKRMNKHYTSKDAEVLIRHTYKAGIGVRLNLIVGFPGETSDAFQETMDFIHKNKEYITEVTNVSSFVLMPGSNIGVYPHRFGITYLDPNDPGSWKDENGLTQEERNDRVSRICILLKELKIRSLILNYQEEKCDVNKALGEEKIVVGAEVQKETDDKEVQECINSEQTGYVRKVIFGKYLLLCVLFVFSLIIDVYLFLLKKIRGSIIFPGS
ncbi:MAG: radical SAM protein [PVC group bacterium]|nr:radical SAM protein [PVC group bacterium]